MLEFYSEILTQNKIDIYSPFSRNKEEYIIPNSYYINSKGYLFNTFGKDGHKEANLIYTYNLIKDVFNDKKYVGLISDTSISLEDELKKEVKNYKRILENRCLSKEDIMNYIHMNIVFPNDPLVVKLVLGIISSKIIVLKKFIELKNNSYDKKKAIEEIIRKSNDDINDILVRYCGFHKIESQIEKTITTSSLDLRIFDNYIDNGFKIETIPKIELNNEKTLIKK